MMLIRLTTGVALICITHFLIMAFGFTPDKLRLAGVLSVSSGMIFLISSTLGLPGIQKKGEEMVMRFLVMTTFQLLGQMALLVFYILRFSHGGKVLAISGIFLFFALLAFQSWIMVKKIRQRDQGQ